MPQPELQLQPFTKLAPDEYRYCSQCKTPLLLKQVEPVRPGLKSRKFECRKCGYVEEIVTPSGIVGRMLVGTLKLRRTFLRR
jgi:hypothetical protein